MSKIEQVQWVGDTLLLLLDDDTQIDYNSFLTWPQAAIERIVGNTEPATWKEVQRLREHPPDLRPLRRQWDLVLARRQVALAAYPKDMIPDSQGYILPIELEKLKVAPDSDEYRALEVREARLKQDWEALLLMTKELNEDELVALRT